MKQMLQVIAWAVVSIALVGALLGIGAGTLAAVAVWVFRHLA